MKDKWLEELREGMSGFEMEAPEGLWESLGVEKPVPKPSWRRLWIAAAAVIAILIIGSGIILWLGKTESLEIKDIKYAKTNGNGFPVQPKRNPATLEKAAPTLNEGLCTTEPQKSVVQNNPGKNKEDADIYVSEKGSSFLIADSVKTETVKPEDQTVNPSREATTEKEHGSARQRTLYVDTAYPKNRKGGSGRSDRFAINVSAAGTGNASEGRDYRMPGMPGDDIFLGSSLVTTEIQHHMPFRIGLTLQYNVTERIALESGLVYSAIGSDISVSQDNRYATGTRRMHYVGMPLNVKLSAWSWKFVNLYLSAGVTGEKCVSNRFETKSTANGLSLDAYSRQRQKPFQWSVNAGAGIQLNPIPNIGIFAEPGVSYYFNDGTSISTVYKERPCIFNLNLGIRFNINP